MTGLRARRKEERLLDILEAGFEEFMRMLFAGRRPNDSQAFFQTHFDLLMRGLLPETKPA